MTTNAVILAAGMGTRLGRPWPKPLTHLADGRTIMQQQMDNLHAAFPENLLILEEFPDVAYVYNEAYDQTNTNRSLLKALRLAPDGGVLWLNGDVVFDRSLLERARALMEQDESFVCVNTSAVGEEEVKYTVDDDGFVLALSKQVPNPLGEAVGINFVSTTDREHLVAGLAACTDADYFERGIEIAIDRFGSRYRPLDISDLFAVEVDFDEDLKRANDHL